MQEHKNKAARRWAVGGLLLALALLGGGGLWLVGGGDPLPMQPAVAPPLSATVPPFPGATASVPAPAALLAVGVAPSAAAPSGLSAMQLAQIEAQWCTHGMQAHRQSEASVFQGAGGRVSTADAQAFQNLLSALDALPTSQALNAVRQRLLRVWVERLQGQGDARSQATAFYLQVEHGAGWSEAAEAAFRQQAASTPDPYVLHLWRQHERTCSFRRSCSAVPPERWSAIEPDNLLAWLPPGLGAVSLTDAQWEGVARAKYLRSYHHDVQLTLLALARELPPGLELDVALTFITQIATLPTVSPDRILAACSPEAVRQTRRQACLHGADLLWRQPQAALMDVAKALAMAKELNAEREGPWPARMTEALALGNFNATEFHMVEMGAAPKAASCEVLAAKRDRLTDIARQGSWRVARRERAATGSR